MSSFIHGAHHQQSSNAHLIFSRRCIAHPLRDYGFGIFQYIHSHSSTRTLMHIILENPSYAIHVTWLGPKKRDTNKLRFITFRHKHLSLQTPVTMLVSNLGDHNYGKMPSCESHHLTMRNTLFVCGSIPYSRKIVREGTETDMGWSLHVQNAQHPLLVWVQITRSRWTKTFTSQCTINRLFTLRGRCS